MYRQKSWFEVVRAQCGESTNQRYHYSVRWWVEEVVTFPRCESNWFFISYIPVTPLIYTRCSCSFFSPQRSPCSWQAGLYVVKESYKEAIQLSLGLVITFYTYENWERLKSGGLWRKERILCSLAKDQILLVLCFLLLTWLPLEGTCPICSQVSRWTAWKEAGGESAIISFFSFRYTGDTEETWCCLYSLPGICWGKRSLLQTASCWSFCPKEPQYIEPTIDSHNWHIQGCSSIFISSFFWTSISPQILGSVALRRWCLTRPGASDESGS